MGMIDTGSHGKRRSVDSELNLVPMIDLLVVTIAFLLLTQTLSSLGRLDATSSTSGPVGCGEPAAGRKLVVDARREGSFVLTWKEGENVVRSLEVPKHPQVARDGAGTKVAYPELEKALADEHKTFGLHKEARDPKTDPLVLRTSNDLPFASLVGLLDASASVRRDGSKVAAAPPAFDVTFAVD